jgi:hypothetical protein
VSLGDLAEIVNDVRTVCPGLAVLWLPYPFLVLQLNDLLELKVSLSSIVCVGMGREGFTSPEIFKPDKMLMLHSSLGRAVCVSATRSGPRALE